MIYESEDDPTSGMKKRRGTNIASEGLESIPAGGHDLITIRFGRTEGGRGVTAAGTAALIKPPGTLYCPETHSGQKGRI